MVVRVAGFNVFLPAVKDRFGSEKFREDATNSPNVNGFSVMTGAKEKLWSTVPVRSGQNPKLGYCTVIGIMKNYHIFRPFKLLTRR